MLIMERTFRLATSGKYWRAPGLLSLCANDFSAFVWKHWQLPKSIQVLTLSLHDRPEPCRLRGRVRAALSPQGQWGVVFGDDDYIDWSLDVYLRPYADKPIYLHVEYDA
ncbi:hypothetical protein LCGC14_0893010 [marine sediment metagenome]|uniref:Uncharacterized protein n=1 Tax=marine sediment metagenome TaxID=412755 RepID=A0A0F9PJC3_9ZZZZ